MAGMANKPNIKNDLEWHSREPEPETYARRAKECRELADAYTKMAGQYEKLASQAASKFRAGKQRILG
jgi:hypothetical protein